MEKNVEFPEKLKIDDPVIYLLGIYQKKLKSLPQKYICAPPTFIAALITIANTRKQSK